MKKPLLSLCASIALLGSSYCAQAQQGASLNFDGVDDHVNLGTTLNPTLDNLNTITVEAWVNTTTTTGLGCIVGNYNTPMNNGEMQFLLRRDNDNYTFWVDDGTSFHVVSSMPASVMINTWQHVAGTWDGSELNIYVDGVLQGTNTGITGANMASTTNNIFIGGNSLGEMFSGNIDEVRIWKATRSAGEIAAYMNCTVSDTAAGIFAMYTFNEAPANGNNSAYTMLHEATGQNPTGVLLGFGLTGTTSNYVADARSNYFSMQSTLTDANCVNTVGGAVTADFNGDGSKDLIVVDWNSLIRMYVNDGKGNFSTSYTNPVAGGGNLETADVDNDGDADLIVANSNTVTVYANDGSGAFSAITGNFFQGSGQANVTKVADLNGDGKKDLIVGNGGSGATDSSLIYYNTGTMGNAAFTYRFGIAPNPARNSIDVGDVNGDGYPDIVTGGSSWGAQLLFNVNNGTSFAMQTPPAGYSGGARFVDWNQDGKLDYMNYDQYNNYGLRYILNDGSGIFAGSATILLQDYNAHVAKLGDLNGDGFLDVVIDNWGGNGRVYLSNGCSLTLQNSCNYSLGRADNNVTLADYNGDGSLDIFCQARCNSSSVYMNYLDLVTGTPLPTVLVSGNTQINYGASTVLTATGASAFQWSANANSATTASVSVSPTIATTYTVVGTNTVGCSSSATVMVSINGAGLNFNGTNNTVDLGMGITNALAGGNQITVEAWVAPTSSTSPAGTIVNNHQNTTQFLLGVTGSEYNFFIGFGAYAVNTPTAVVTPGSWQHVAGVYDGSSIMIYVNGVLQGTTPVTSPFTFPASGTTTKMGSDAFGEFFDGSIDEVRIWNRALCPGEIQNNMNAELHLPQTGLLGYYHLNHGVAGANNAGITTAVDSSGNANNGTLINFALNGSTSNWIAPGGVMTGSYSPTYVVPTLTVSGTTAICNGQSTVLTASGANTYTWAAGPSTASYSVSPTSDTPYSVSGTKNGCPTNVTTVTVTVNALPSVSASATSMTICLNDDDTLNASGAVNYTWSSNAGSVNTASAVITPTVTGSDTYTVTGTDANTCSNTATVSVTVITCSTGINQQNGGWVVYPNPSNGNFTLRSESEIGSVEVRNALGEVVYKAIVAGTSLEINLTNNAAGVYYLNANGKKMMLSKQ